MPRKSALLAIQEIKQPSTAKTPICLWTYIIQTVIQGLWVFFFSLFFIMLFHIPFEVQTSQAFSFFILPCLAPVQVTEPDSSSEDADTGHRAPAGTSCPRGATAELRPSVPTRCAGPLTHLRETKDDTLSLTIPGIQPHVLDGSDGFCTHESCPVRPCPSGQGSNGAAA